MNGRRPAHAIEVGEIEQLLRDEAERLMYELLPNAKRDGRHLCIGSLGGEPGQSLKMELTGLRKGCWRDFNPGYGAAESGDCLHLIRHVLFTGDMGEAIKWARSWLNLDDLDPGRLEIRRAEAREKSRDAAQKDAEERELRRKRAVGLWHSGVPIAGTPAEAYLRGRGIELSPQGLDRWPGSLRFHAEVWNREEKLKMPAMLASMMTPDGRHIATHRTYLSFCQREGWAKMDSRNAKMVLGSCRGSFIPLRKGASGKSMSSMPVGEWIHMPEGIEDALTGAMARPDLRVGAGYSLGNIGGIEWPRELGGLTIWADRDEPGSPAALGLEKVISVQQARGVAVRTVMPPPGYKDLNEWLQAMLRDARAAARRAQAGAA